MKPARVWIAVAALVGAVLPRVDARVHAQTVGEPIRLSAWADQRADEHSGGEGKMAVATQLRFDKKEKTIIFENYSSEPVRLTNVRIER
jgi:hypothetical protein